MFPDRSSNKNAGKPQDARPLAEAADGASNAEKARALLELLGESPSGAGDAQVPPEHLRAWARDLVRSVEAKPRPAAPAPDASAPDASRSGGSEAGAAENARRLFSRASPFAAARPAAAPPSAEPSSAASPKADAADLSAPMPVRMPRRQSIAAAPATLSSDAVRRLAAAVVDAEDPHAEHPAIIAMLLEGRSSLDQAAALRRLPARQARQVHRALRQMEQARR